GGRGAGGAHECEAAGRSRLDRGAGREQARLECRRSGDRVAVEPDGGVDRLDPLDVAPAVAALEVGARRGLDLAAAKRLLEREEPLRRLGMPVRRVQVREVWVAQEVDLTASATVSRSAAPPSARPRR